ncbi:hypothetical protein DS745_11820 [Anaerobacillus alkaliphilus]|uniref:SgrR family transcriptional regulator n=1 Tax=Anaerobacillus alkaliphilus TaxID=1548597 RepID=A0A4Q0VTI6_9BACI|nr:ABC transporter substrate-binding protein [Anaerobacillus alkaliphilus]RXJ00738.1 hypothetical protein DS745_11820 [Anaerobacillus alkaliphilus]
MNVLEHFVTLRLTFLTTQENEEVLTTIPYIADKLACTERNTNFIIKKMTENGWITWYPKKGRGKQSTLLFHLSLHEVSVMNVNRLILDNKIEEAYLFITTYKFPSEIKAVLLNLFQDHFGFTSTFKENKRQDVLRIPTDTKVFTLDPQKVAIVHEAHIVSQVFDTLICLDNKSGTFQPKIAMAWEQKHGIEWTFYLRKGILFHHGRKLTAEDVQFTFHRLMTDKTIPTSGLFDVIEKVEIIDEITIQFILKYENHLFLDLLSCFYSSIIPYDVNIELKSIGTGPFSIAKRDDCFLVLEANHNHFLGRPFLDQIEICYVPETISDSFLTKDQENNETKVFNELGSYFLIFNFNKVGIHHNLYFRKAIELVLNQSELVEQLGYPRGMVAKSFLVNKSELDADIISSNEKALDNLKLSNYNGETIEVATFESKEAIEDMNWLKSNCERIGISLTIHQIPLETIYNPSEMSKYDAFYCGETFDENQLLSLYLLFKSENSLLRFGLNQKLRNRIDALLKEVQSTIEPNERLNNLLNIEEWLLREAIVILTYHTVEEQRYHKSLKGVELSGFGMPDFRQLWIKREKEDQNDVFKCSIYIP